MCGIVGGVAQRDVAPILIEGLKRLEYRGYDSAGLAVLDQNGHIQRHRAKGKVAMLEAMVNEHPVPGGTGIAHTRWATHGEPSVENAHPHVSSDEIVLVHNGIIENYASLREQLKQQGYVFSSQTDTEVIVHLIHSLLKESDSLLQAVHKATGRMKGAFSLGVMHIAQPDVIVTARQGSPLVIGIGIGEHFIASDVFALLPVTQKFIFLEEGDIAQLTRHKVDVFNACLEPVVREARMSEVSGDAAGKGEYRHFMLKEIYEQPVAIANTLEGRLIDGQVDFSAFGQNAENLLRDIKNIQIIACGTSYHAGLVGKYWLENYTGIPVQVEVASEFRYRHVAVPPGTLFLSISQSGETADTLAALRAAKQAGQYLGSLSICNVPESSLVRESDLVFMTHAGPEIGVASTKAFTTQLVSLLMLTAALTRFGDAPEMEREIVAQIRQLPALIENILKHDTDIEALSEQFIERHHSLFLGRGPLYPIAMEGALKLKEISYIHAESYPAGELKHGPLALVDAEMPIVAVAPNDELLDKLKSNLEEVRARGGVLYVFADSEADIEAGENLHVIKINGGAELINPITFVIPLQLLSYHVAVLRGTDVDQPRNLAKSVTVE